MRHAAALMSQTLWKLETYYGKVSVCVCSMKFDYISEERFYYMRIQYQLKKVNILMDSMYM